LDQYRRSPLHWAAFFGRISALVAIVSHVAHACPQEQVRPFFFSFFSLAFFGWISALVAVVSHVAHACPQEQVRP
jgi:hypothetical protein